MTAAKVASVLRGSWMYGSLLIASMVCRASPAQVPATQRSVHPTIANPLPGAVVQPAPVLAVADGVWNHGEGFGGGGGAAAADTGGWFGADDGTSLAALDVHRYEGVGAPPPWATYAWNDPLPPNPVVATRRYVGFLRPTDGSGMHPPLPMIHPLYGALGASYVDQAAFEAFVPVVGRAPTQKILICVLCRETLRFPLDHLNRDLDWRQVYRGFFSPDGLVRREPPGSRSAAAFLANTDPDAVDRPPLTLIDSWSPASDYWPVLVYPVLSVMHRSTTLNEQRQLQVAQAVKLLLQQATIENPLGAGNALTSQQVDDEVVVTMIGGSNGGLQGGFSAMVHPQLVHGCYAEVFSPSAQRFFGEHDLGHLLARRSGSSFYGAGVRQSDFLWWNQYAWANGLELNDLSFARQFVAGQTVRPSCFVVGDEDITSTGTDWAALFGPAWSDHGLVQSTSGFGAAQWNTFAWMVAENTCHVAAVVPTTNPYTGQGPEFIGRNTAHETFTHAVRQRDAELQGGFGTPGPPAHAPRLPAQQWRGLDDPQEWFLGRGGDAAAPVGGPLQRDDAWFDAMQPDSAGTMPGHREAMFIADRTLFVGNAEGFVCSFVVDDSDPLQPLQRVSRSDHLGTGCFAIAPDTNSSEFGVIAATRRHLYRLDRLLQTVAGPVTLPWQVAQPRHLQVADLLENSPGDEIVFHSVHGGLVFYRAEDLTPVWEWPEPGIIDFEVDGGDVVVLSARGVVARLHFVHNGDEYKAQLRAVSEALPSNWQAGPPTQGEPLDLELMRVNWAAAGLGNNLAAISVWRGDVDGNPTGATPAGNAVRAHWLGDLSQQAYINNVPRIDDIATCDEQPGYFGRVVGDHTLVLGGDLLLLYDQFGQQIGAKALVLAGRPDGLGPIYYPFGSGSHTMVVGELVDNPGGSYPQEIVVATRTGLMWLHVDDLITAPGTLELPGLYVPRTVVGGSAVATTQPRTNRTLASAWAIDTDATGSRLDVLDQRGGYWRIDDQNGARLYDADAITDARQWSRAPQPASTQLQASLQLFGGGASPRVVARTHPWCPIDSGLVIYESSGGGYLQNNWHQRNSDVVFFHGRAVHGLGGCVLPRSPAVVAAEPLPQTTATAQAAPVAEYDVFHWTIPAAPGGAGGPWGDMVEGMRVRANGQVSAIWASTGEPANVLGAIGDRVPYHWLRTNESATPIMTQQALKAVQLAHPPNVSHTLLVLGCPGGRVRCIVPGRMRSDEQTGHELGSIDSSDDYGYGGCALDVRVDDDGGSDLVQIWFGTISHPTPAPTNYADPEGQLADGEVATGAVHHLQWRPGIGFQHVSTNALFPDATHPRGAYGVVGLKVADLLVDPAHPGDELIVGTLSGDLIVYQADTMAEIWRTHLPGSIGNYNSIVVADLDANGVNELYVAGSWGLHRFTVQ